MTSQTKLAFAIWVALIQLVVVLGWRHVIGGSSVGFALCGLIAYALVFRIFTSFYSADARRLKAAWESFSELPGEHLRWHQTARGISQIVARNGRVLATVEGLGVLFRPWTAQSRGFFAPSLSPRLPRRVKVGRETYLIDGWQQNARVTGPDGMAAVSFMGRNFDHQALAVAHMPNGQMLRFPVQGTTRWSAVMTATDDSDLPVFRIRRVRSTGPGPEHKNRVEIVVEPGSQITTELVLAMVAGYQNLDSFFDRPDG